MSTESRPSKIQKREAYKLYYWPGIPGRGEYIRLAFEFSGASYTEAKSAKTLLSTITNPAKTGGCPHFAPPAVELPSGRFLSQTPAVLNYLAPRLGLAGWMGEEDEGEKEELRSLVNQLVLTALDLSNEAHDVHHPIAVSLYYEDQKDAALARAEDFRGTRIPKFLSHFQKVLESNRAGKGTHLVSSSTTTADLVLFQVLEGLSFAFPKRMAALRSSDKYDNVFKLQEHVKNEKGIKEYLASDRRQEFSMGIYRYYEELDAEN